ncbi:hypothetical protein BB561_004350 [Smittium simulii]|uniref:Uncharacterized protein n=1 Tax=Smittium simulii TaxID=133385 RepID=A0A2T9YGT1_9FUNG|nr:hypothetical protein BB561_004350 [Smittium simulii]
MIFTAIEVLLFAYFVQPSRLSENGLTANKNSSLFVRGVGDKVNASSFSKSCPVYLTSLSTAKDKIKSNSHESGGVYQSFCNVVQPCSSTYFHMTFTVDVQNSPDSNFYVTASAYDNVSLDNAIWFGSATKSSQKAYIREWANHGRTPQALSGIDPFLEGPKIAPSPSNLYFILYDSTGLYFGVNGYITAQAINQAFVRKTLVFENVYFTINSYKNDIATMDNIQYKCLSSDSCENRTPVRCKIPVTITSLIQQTKTIDVSFNMTLATASFLTLIHTSRLLILEKIGVSPAPMNQSHHGTASLEEQEGIVYD